MTPAEQIKQLVSQLVKVPTVVVIGEVTKVGSETCVIKLSSNLELPDVRLRQAVDGSQNYFIRFPKKGAQLTAISLTGDLRDVMMLEASEYESISYVQDGIEFTMDSKTGKFTIKNDKYNMYDLVADFCSAIKMLTVSTPNGPSGTPLPPTIQAVTQIETKFKQLLKQ